MCPPRSGSPGAAPAAARARPGVRRGVPRQRRREISDRIERTARGRAWIVPCPVRQNHLIALVPPDTRAGRPERLDKVIARQVPECRVGVSAEVPLREAASGYEQACHALAVARGTPDRYAGYTRHTDLGALAGPPGRTWARELLDPACGTCRRAGPTPAPRNCWARSPRGSPSAARPAAI
ncbi:hypothetical protein NKH77_33095 [Streptomyces sp. M19]